MPPELVSLRYREMFHLTWWEFMATPWDVVMLDLAILHEQSNVIKLKKK